ncbi:nucleotidyltransferase family protein [Ruminococcus sp. Marseille-P6503]|uniref:tRNA(Met) cytidine acetate ligase n=1 Tax=Ruminococcus sp. Marseille-P6503 TaxID=2364796 RepID=UPI000F53EF84|nr:nucleotidyltransferase family protein [Ruminococcus sp. Marseille-P6503]
MLTAGIIAEFNPFHNGHKYLADQTRKNGATHVVAVMSGAAVQRGECAAADKYFRARAAVKNGVDLVIELPCPFSCSSGELFALSAVRILASLGSGVVNRLSFGSEVQEAELLKRAADASEELKDSGEVRKKLSEGKSYPLAVYEAALEKYGTDVGEALAKPNSILAVEYIKALRKLAPDIEPSPVQRKAVGHDDGGTVGDFASASAVRNMLRNGENACRFIPDGCVPKNTCFMENMQSELLFRLSCADKESLLELPDVSGEIADRIITVMKQMPLSSDEFFSACKSRNITMARLRRIALYLVLGVKSSDLIDVPYIRILAFNGRGKEILARCKSALLPVDTSLKRLEQTSVYAARVSQLEQNAVRLQYFCSNRKEPYISDYQRKISLSE